VSFLLGLLLLPALVLALNRCSRLILPSSAGDVPTLTLSWEGDRENPPLGPNPQTSLPPPEHLATHLTPEVLSVEEAVEWEGEWVLLDRRGGRLHFLDRAGSLTRSFGREGEGPGELRDPVAMVAVDSVLWVLNRRGMILDRFSRAGKFLGRREIQGGGCLVGLAKEMVTIGSETPLLLRWCPPSRPGPGTAWVERISEEGILSPVLAMPLGKPGSRRLHLGREPSLSGTYSRFFLGTWDSPCFTELHGSGIAAGVRCLPPYSRPLTQDEDKQKLHRRFQSIERLGLLPLEVPRHLPWYDRTFAFPEGLVVLRIRSADERDLVLLPPSGGSVHLDLLLPPNTFIGAETILSVRDRLHGTQVDLYANPWHVDGKKVPQ
jgi:hypothetical protein